MKEKRIAFVANTIHVREAAEGQEASRTVEGRAVVFNRETVLWDGKYERIREIIAPSCFDAGFLAEQDIKLNLLHARQDSVARCNKGVGTLNIEVREDGVYFTAEMPKCDIGDRALALIANGTYTGCSFEFYEQDYTEETTTLPDGREDILITHTKMKAVTALTIAMDPAYEDTSIKVAEARERESNKDDDLKNVSRGTLEQQTDTDVHNRENIRKQVKELRDLAADLANQDISIV